MEWFDLEHNPLLLIPPFFILLFIVVMTNLSMWFLMIAPISVGVSMFLNHMALRQLEQLMRGK